MMQIIAHAYQRLDRVQRALWFKLAASVLAIAACAGYFGSLLVSASSINSQRDAIAMALTSQNVTKGDELAVSLRDHGDVVVNNHRYGGQWLLDSGQSLFDQDGNVASPWLLANRLVADQRPQWAPEWLLEQPQTTWMLAFLVTAWLLLIIWMQITVPFLLTLSGTAICVWLCWMLNSRQAMLAFGGMGLLTFTFVLLTRASLAVLSPRNQALAVAHTVVKEASRTRIPLVFIILLLVLLPLLPMWIDPSSPLRFRLQTFISASLGVTFAVAAVMTLFFSCASVAFEIRDRQIWHLMTKPLSRLNYLVGKWLGVLTVNIIILLVAGVSTLTFIKYLSRQPVASGEAGVYDAVAVRDEVLAARIGSPPQYVKLEPEELRRLIDKKVQDDPVYSERKDIPLFLRKHWEDEFQQNYSLGQRSIGPGSYRKFTFTGLKAAKGLNSTLTLRYRFHILGDDEHQIFKAMFVFLDDQDGELAHRSSTYVPTIAHSFPINPAFIQDDGTLRVVIVNNYEAPEHMTGLAGALNFEEKDFELLYKVDTFEANFLRALLTMWIKLAVLAAVGTCCATFLSFPVACLLSFTILIGGILGPYLNDALAWYYPEEIEKVNWSNVGAILDFVFTWVTRQIALGTVFLLSSFGEYRPTQSLVEGRLIPWSAVVYGLLRLGLLWSGISMIIGYIVLRRRQLAIYSGHG